MDNLLILLLQHLDAVIFLGGESTENGEIQTFPRRKIFSELAKNKIIYIYIHTHTAYKRHGLDQSSAHSCVMNPLRSESWRKMLTTEMIYH